MTHDAHPWKAPGMKSWVVRLGVGYFALTNLLFGVWASVAPKNYFESFPGGGHTWVALDGPYNEHLMRDYGALNLALGVVALCAAVWLTRTLAITAALAWIVYSIPHIAYHALNGQAYDTSDHVAIVGSLLFAPVVGFLVIWAARSLGNGRAGA